MQGQVRVARLAFMRPNFRNLALFQVGWPTNFVWLFSGLILTLWVFIEIFIWQPWAHKRTAWGCRGCGRIPNDGKLAIFWAKFLNICANSTATFTFK